MTLMTNSEEGVSAFPEGENLFKWIGTITGPRDTVSEQLQNSVFKFKQKITNYLSLFKSVNNHNILLSNVNKQITLIFFV